MEKRYVTFIILSLVLVVGHQLIMATFFPPDPAAVEEARNEGEPPEPPGPGEPDDDPKNKEEPTPDDPPKVGKDDPPKEKPGDDEAKDRPPVALQWAVLGNYRSSKHIVYLSNQGAAVRCVELVERRDNGRLRYRDLVNKSGYLGYLGLQAKIGGGCRINVVGPGTPADEAGLVVGDIIQTAAGIPIDDPSDLDAALSSTKPGDSLELEVRGAGGPKNVTATLDQRPLALIHNEVDVAGDELGHPGSFLVSLESIREGENRTVRTKQGEHEIANLRSTRTGIWEMKATEKQVEFTWVYNATDLNEIEVNGELEIKKVFTLLTTPGEDEYHLDFDLEFRNRGESPLRIAYRLDGPNGLPTEGWWYLYKVHPSWGTGGARDIAWRSDAVGYELRSASQIWKRARNEKAPTEPAFVYTEDATRRSIYYAGVDTQYFHVALLPKNEAGERAPQAYQELTPFLINDADTLDKHTVRLGNVSFYLISEEEFLEPDASVKSNYNIFLGPKRSQVLSAYGLDETIVWGWFWWVAWPLSSVLHFFYMLVGNYGLAILFLTVLVRACVHPISRKAHQNAQMMQALAPETKKITEKYKDEPQKRMEAQQELYKKYNFNPLSGCLLAFAQFPIFIGLYRCLSVDIELRDAPLIPGVNWCTNLAGPDMLYEWGPNAWAFLTDYNGWLGPYFNILPLVSVALFLVQQQMFTPPPTDEQQAMSQKMMKGMTFFIGVLFYKVASGLCLYIIISSLWGVLERQFMPKKDLEQMLEQKKKKAPVEKPKRSAEDQRKAEDAVKRKKKKGKGR